MFKFKPLNDRTKGLRFYVLGLQGLYRKRSTLRRKLSLVSNGKTFVALHYGLRSLYWENKQAAKLLHNFAG